jgi:hypothetical protein
LERHWWSDIFYCEQEEEIDGEEIYSHMLDRFFLSEQAPSGTNGLAAHGLMEWSAPNGIAAAP